MTNNRSVKTSLSIAFWSLAVINAALGLSLASQWVGGNQAMAQQQPAGEGDNVMAQAVRRPGDYLIVPGRAQGMTVGLIHVLDSANGELTAVAFDESTNTLQAMPKINLQVVVDEALRRQRAGNAPAAPSRRGNR